MRVISEPLQLKAAVAALKRRGKTIGFVPTMGALHEGHASLFRRARRENGAVVVSIFVNPLQFGPREDFKRYPRPVEKDKALCRGAGTDILFIPAAKSVLRLKSLLRASVPNRMDRHLCGPFRPGHFKGVVRIVALLFRLVSPDRAYFGLKDYQQYRIIEAMSRRTFGKAVRVIGCPTVRERNGLALSSRNRYLSPKERKTAAEFYKSLQFGRMLVRRGVKNPREVVQKVTNRLLGLPGFRPQYVEIVDSINLKKVVELMDSRRPLLAAAVHLGGTRLIDNILV